MSSNNSREELEKQIAELQRELAASKQELSDSQKLNMELASIQPFLGSTVEERATGKTISESICLNPWERDTKKHKFKTFEKPTYFYTINLPPSAGWALTTNGIDYYHTQTYEFDIDMLREIKSRVDLCWRHERSIKTDNENAYRKPQ